MARGAHGGETTIPFESLASGSIQTLYDSLRWLGGGNVWRGLYEWEGWAAGRYRECRRATRARPVAMSATPPLPVQAHVSRAAGPARPDKTRSGLEYPACEGPDRPRKGKARPGPARPYCGASLREEREGRGARRAKHPLPLSLPP